MAALRARWLGLAAGYVGAVVGAGFASGREIMHFFARHGVWGVCGAALAGLLFAAAGATILQRITVQSHRHYGTLLRDLCGERLGATLDHLGSVFLFVGLVAVTAGAGALARLSLHVPAWTGLAAFAAALAASMLGGRRIHTAANLIVVPIIVGICLVAAATSFRTGLSGWRPVPPPPSWLVPAVLYVAYNLLLGLAGLCAAADGKQSRRDARIGGWVGGVTLGLLCAAVTVGLLGPAIRAHRADLPLVLALPEGPLRSFGYPLALLAALWTTGSASAIALGTRIAPTAPRQWAALAAASAAPFAAVGLSPIVTLAYPLMGYAGVPLMVALALRRPANARHPRGGSGWQGPDQRLP